MDTGTHLPDAPPPEAPPEYDDAPYGDASYAEEHDGELPVRDDVPEPYVEPDWDALWDTATAGLNAPQLEAVENIDGPMVVVAGPGSGKTRVLTHRIAAMVASGVDTRRVLAITFTNKAAGEMRERVARLLDGYVDEGEVARMWVSTFHSACARILREHAPLAGRSKRFGIADADDSRRILSRLLSQAGIADQARDIHSQISLAKNKMLSPSSLQGHQWHPQLAHWWREYQKALEAQDLFDFDDLLLSTLTVLAQNPEVAQSYQRRFTHVLVDEFQDTNAVQYQILRQLGGHGNVCVVGDEKQAIYGFRGATPSVLNAFERDWPQARVVVLAENYRSTPEILAVAQAVIDQNPTERRTELTTSNPKGEAVRLVVCDRDLDEARFVAREVASSPTGPGEHAIIYRTNAQSRVLEQAMRDAGVPYRIVGGVSFFDHAEVRDAMAWMRLALNPMDREALRRAAACPKRGIGDGTLDAVLAVADELGCAPLEVLERAPDRLATRPRNTLGSLAADLLDVVDAVEMGPAAMVDAVLGVEGLVDAAVSRDGRDNPDQRRENLRELAASARSFLDGSSMSWPREVLAELDGPERCDAFMANAALLSGGEEDERVECVQLMTAHACKGREFDVVFVTGVEDGFFPHSSASAEEWDEEVRLLFVAASRARKRLTLTRAETRFRFQGTEWRDESPFLPPLEPLVVATRDGLSRSRTGGFSSRRSSAGGYGGGRGGGRGGWSGGDRPAGWSGGGRSGGRSASLVPAAVPEPPKGPRLTAEQLHEGAEVVHDTYGNGTVVSFDAEVAHVRFTSGLRVMMLSAAPMRLARPDAE